MIIIDAIDEVLAFIDNPYAEKPEVKLKLIGAKLFVINQLLKKGYDGKTDIEAIFNKYRNLGQVKKGELK